MLVVVLFLTLGMGAMALAHLTRVVSEDRKIQSDHNARRARAMADGELQIAENIVNAAPYLGSRNTALLAAAAANPPVIPGTSVEVERVPGAAGWYSLVARGEFMSSDAVSHVLVRDQKPTSSYNYFVIDHPLGLSGRPRGMIHSNKTIDFFFPGGYYRDRVSAVEGFNWRSGADLENTTFVAGANGSAQYTDPLAEAQVTDAKAVADTLLVEDNYEAEIGMEGDTVEVDLYAPAHHIYVPVTRTRRVLDHYDPVPSVRRVPVYTTVTEQVTRPTYTSVTTPTPVQVPIRELQEVEVQVQRRVWVEEDPPPPENVTGGAIATGSLGSWQTITVTETQQQWVTVGYETEIRDITTREQTGTETVDVQRRVLSHYEDQDYIRQVPVYRQEEYQSRRRVWVPRTFVSRETVPSNGTIYIEGKITRFGGELTGQLSVVTNGSVKITDSVQYVDRDGDPAMLGGEDPEDTYEPNQAYSGDAVLSLTSRADIIYSRDCPQNLEINAALTSTQGKVAFEGLVVSADGKSVTGSFAAGDSRYIKESLRRLGGIMSRLRPVSTWVGPSGGVLAGFEDGQSVMDPRLMLEAGGAVTPPFTFQLREPMWGVRSSGRLLDVPR